MSEDTQVDTETTVTTTTETPAQTPEREVTLDDVYRQAGIEAQPPVQQQPIQQQPVQQQAPAQPAIPDPYDTEAFKGYMRQQQQGVTSLQQATSQVVGYLSQLQAKEAKATLDADIGKAVSTVNDVVGHPKPKVIEAMLDAKARENPQFKALWDNRAKNPAAFNSALKIVAKEFAQELDVKVDPRLVESNRALKIAQRQMATTAAEPETSAVEDRLGKATGKDFEIGWEQLVSGGH